MKTPYPLRAHHHRYPSSSGAPPILLGALVNVLIIITLMVFSYLREEPLFWRHEGEFPIWLRELVMSTYYPMLLLELLLLAAFTGFVAHLLSRRSTSASLAVLLLPMLWGLYFMVIANSVANNLDNLFNGRPLHWHPDGMWYQL